MTRISIFRLLVIFLVSAAVLTVLIAPFVDLQPTALRAWRAAVAVAMAITLAARRIHSILAIQLGASGASIARETHVSQAHLELDLWNLVCARLC